MHGVAVAAGAGVQADVGALVGGEALEDSVNCVSGTLSVYFARWRVGVVGASYWLMRRTKRSRRSAFVQGFLGSCLRARRPVSRCELSEMEIACGYLMKACDTFSEVDGDALGACFEASPDVLLALHIGSATTQMPQLKIH